MKGVLTMVVGASTGSKKGIVSPELRKPAEIAICGPEPGDAVLNAKSCYTGIMDLGPLDSTSLEILLELSPVTL